MTRDELKWQKDAADVAKKAYYENNPPNTLEGDIEKLKLMRAYMAASEEYQKSLSQFILEQMS